MNKTTLLASAVATVFAASFATSAFAGPAPENTTSCTGLLCIDTSPQGKGGLDGSGGWGYNFAKNQPVDTLKVGLPANFTVTVMQPNDGSIPFCGGSGSITLTYSSQDFSLSLTDSRNVTGTDPFDRGGVAVFAYDANFWCHTDQSVGFAFTPLNETKDVFALVTATITVDGQQAWGPSDRDQEVVKQRQRGAQRNPLTLLSANTGPASAGLVVCGIARHRRSTRSVAGCNPS